jgi:AraC family transcriptional regulator of adaptative response/methylated-DNA-[protein]-cysteine methyltransferase
LLSNLATTVSAFQRPRPARLIAVGNCSPQLQIESKNRNAAGADRRNNGDTLRRLRQNVSMNARSNSIARTSPTNDSEWRWKAVVDRDWQADGKFFYCVKTTGIYCRPSCPSRRPKRENVDFRTTQEAAEKAGFRPCKRCKPCKPSLSESHAALVAKACRRIEAAETSLSLPALAREAGVSPYHFHRLFKRVTGLTPKAYGVADRAGRLRSQLRRDCTVTEAIFDAGFNSGGRFYETAHDVLGMTPSTFRAGGRNTTIWFAIGQVSLGAILVARSEKGVCAILLGKDPEALVCDLQDCFPEANLVGGDKEFEKLLSKVVGLVEAPGIGLGLPLDIRGTAFQQRVWNALRKIPVGPSSRSHVGGRTHSVTRPEQQGEFAWIGGQGTDP